MFCYHVSDLHGRKELYEKLCDEIIREKPEAVFIGGDVFPNFYSEDTSEFLNKFMAPLFELTQKRLGSERTPFFLILGNDDAKAIEEEVIEFSMKGLWSYINQKAVTYNSLRFWGYSYVPPSPFLLKDWEKYDVSRYIDPGAISPEEGVRTVDEPKNIAAYSTISADLERLVGNENIRKDIFLFHAPPYKTNLDRIYRTENIVDYVERDLNVGSIAIRKFIEKRAPLVTLHGHVHESAKITGSWEDKIGDTYCFSAAHNGTELSIVKFETNDLSKAARVLI